MDESEYEVIYKEEDSHWWFKGRRYVSFSILADYYKNKDNLKILDFGCGSGRNMIELRRLGSVEGIDIFKKCLDFCKDKGLKISLIDISKKGTNIRKYENKYNLITCFDVLEHIQEDIFVLARLNKFLRKEGRILVTVPSFRFLWSNNDKIAQHIRRYDKKELKRKLEESGFEIELISYYNFFIFPFAVLRKMINPKKSSTELTKSISGNISQMIYKFERFLMKKGLIPFGVSIVCLAKKR